MIYGIPVVIWIDSVHREQAVSLAQHMVRRAETDVEESVVGFSMPNDYPQENEPYHLVWRKGVAPEVIDEEWEYDTTTGSMRRMDNG